MHLLLEHVSRLPTGDAQAIHRLLNPSVLADIAHAPALGWLPIEHELACARAVSFRLGMRRAHEFYAALAASACERPPLQNVVEAIRKSCRGDVLEALRAIPKAKALLVREAGRWSVASEPGAAAMLTVTDIPELLARDAIWAQAQASELGAWYAIAGARGTVMVHEASVPRRQIVFRFRWS